MHYFYIIYSKKVDKFYTGETNDLSLHLEKHNSGSYNLAYIKITKDWQYVFTCETQIRDDAFYLERFVKRMKSRKFIQKIIINKNILTDILRKR